VRAAGTGRTAGAALAGGGAAGAAAVAEGRETDGLHRCNFKAARAARKLKKAARAKMATREAQISRGTFGRSESSADSSLRE
jgi:hypothetical protein